MSETLQELGPYERILTIELAEADLDAAKNRAARKISRELNIKGFRPGKAPRRIVEATVGAERVRAEAIDEVLPDVVGGALEEAALEPAVAPSVEALRDVDGGGVEVDVKVTLWPTVDKVPQYENREIEVERPEIDDEVVEAQIDRLREQFAELETVDRPSHEGDYVSINLSTTRNGEPVPEVSATDLLYEIGSQSLIEGLDEHVIGRSAGVIEKFDTTLPDRFGELAGQSVTIQVLVKEVKEKRLPELTDEWVSDFTEFESLEDLRSDLVARMEEMRLGITRETFQAKLMEALLEEMELDIPEGLVNAEMEEIFHRFSHRLSDSGIEFNDYLEVTGMTQEAFLDDLRQQALRSVRTDILLDTVAESAGLEVDDGELASVYEALATQGEEEPAELATRFAGTVQEKRIVGDILRRKALAAIVEGAVAVDENGTPIDLGQEDVEPSPEAVENSARAEADGNVGAGAASEGNSAEERDVPEDHSPDGDEEE